MSSDARHTGPEETIDLDAVDYFRDPRTVRDPFPIFDHMRAQCPVHQEPHHGVFMVTSYEHVVEVLNDTDRFSSCISTTGPFSGVSMPVEGRDDVSELIEEHRPSLPFNDQLPTFDPPVHTEQRGLLMRLITPKRLAENEAAMYEIAERQIDEFIDRGECEYVHDYAAPFALLVVADLLGVPDEDRERFRNTMLRRDSGGGAGAMGGSSNGGGGREAAHAPLAWLYDQFSEYVADRRQNPRDDVLTGLAQATFPDGRLPEVIDAVRIAANLYAAGQETTVRLLSTALMLIGERPDIQARLREDPGLVRNFIEECLRLESPVKGDFRMAKRNTSVAGVEIPAGSILAVLNGAANRDPEKFSEPDQFVVDRADARHHIAFGRGPHTCPGAPLARAEAVISVTRLLERTSDIRISERVHGPAGARVYRYMPTFMLRGLSDLTIEFDAVRRAFS